MQPRCDSHVHFFTQDDLRSIKAALPYALPEPHPLKAYLDRLLDAGIKPVLLNNVHLSILPDSENVFHSFAQLDGLQQQNPDRYGDIRLVGTIKADPAYATAQRLAHPQVVGVRIVLHDTPAEAIAEDAFCTPAWLEMFARLRADQHVHVYAKSPASNVKALKQIPESVAVAIDHLGCCYAGEGADSADYQALLALAKVRGNVFFKGPGYRTSINVASAVPFAAAIVNALGAEKLLLDATDAPHVGADEAGEAFAAHFTPEKTFAFTQELAQRVADRAGCQAAAILNDNQHLLFNAQPKQALA